MIMVRMLLEASVDREARSFDFNLQDFNAACSSLLVTVSINSDY